MTDINTEITDIKSDITDIKVSIAKISATLEAMQRILDKQDCATETLHGEIRDDRKEHSRVVDLLRQEISDQRKERAEGRRWRIGNVLVVLVAIAELAAGIFLAVKFK
jgi:t-SNARE complex subunit (syntaxin)